MKRDLVILAAIAVLAVGCGTSSKRGVVVGEVVGDLVYRSVGSDGQEEGNGFTLAGDAPLEVNGLNVGQIEGLLRAQSVANRISIDVGKVGGKMTIERIGSNMQNSRAYEIKSASEHILVGELESQIMTSVPLKLGPPVFQEAGGHLFP